MTFCSLTIFNVFPSPIGPHTHVRNRDLITKHDLYRVMRGFNRIIATGVTCCHRKLFPPDIWSRHLGLENNGSKSVSNECVIEHFVASLCNFILLSIICSFRMFDIQTRHTSSFFSPCWDRSLFRTFSYFFRTMRFEIPSVLSRLCYGE